MKTQTIPEVIELVSEDGKSRIQIIEPTNIDTVTVQLANKDNGRKISIPMNKAEHLKVEVSSRLWIVKATFNGRPAVLVTQPFLS